MNDSTTSSPKPNRTLVSFDKASKSRELLASVNTEYDRKLREDQLNINAFPCLPSDERVRHSLRTFRNLVSEPSVSQLVCAVCAERRFASDFQTFRIGAVVEHDNLRRSKLPQLSESLLQSMKAKLVHDPAMPSHLSLVSGGLCRSGLR